ncbi:MAG: RIP metalloprotease RseP [Bacteroidales bacterium]|nr:RIP metalloprotease RseP [Bacteroidales bacterium]
MIALIKALQVILALSFLIFIHELGHFAWAKAFHIKVEKFYLFFDIGGKHLARWHWGETEFGIGWLPLGGYCKIAGMVDESMDLEQLRQEPQPWEFRTHPAWQRLLVMFGGVLNNFIFAILAFILIMGIWGEAVIPARGTKVYVSELASEMGFRNGDEILDLDGRVPKDFLSIQSDMARRGVRKVNVLRGTDTLGIYIDHAMIEGILNTPLMFDIAVPFVVDSVVNAANGCLSKGDRIVGIAEYATDYLQDARTALAGHKGECVWATVLRGADTLAVEIQVDTAGMIGVTLPGTAVELKEYNALQAIPAGLALSWETVSGYLKDLKLLATPSTGAYKSVGSFVAIGQIMPSVWDWHQFLYILALLSIMLGVMNLLPIPGLDGGHILFTLYEMVTGRKQSEKFLYIAQLIGMALLIMLMMLAFGNDIGRIIH